MRVLIAVTHLLGAGHLTRAAALARAFAEAGHETTLVSGGNPVRLAALENVALAQLPPVHIRGTDFKTLRDETGELIGDAQRRQRRDALVQTIRATKPDILITELFPFGRRALADEFDALLDEARRLRPRPPILCSIRDILVTPLQPERIAATHERILREYDAVLVHGDPRLVPLEASWPIDGRIAPLIRYTGYVDENPGPIPERRRRGIVVSGGSSAASLPLYRAAIAAARGIPEHPWHFLIGRAVGEDDFQTLKAQAPAHARVERARPDFRAVLSQAELSVSQAGYNTVVDLLRVGIRAVLAPFESGHETEQRLRAERLRDLGLAETVPESDLSPERLGDAIRQSLARPIPCPPRLFLDGARRSVAIAERLALGAPALRRTIDWSPLDRALSRAEDRDCPIRFWWRDDDAVSDTPRLGRLLALARDHEAGIALAGIPQKLEASLAARLREDNPAFALVHGWSHANHAPAGEKKAEFGPHRSLDTMASEIEQALGRAKKIFGAKLLPVFVPPWNRIAPDLVPLLPRLGFKALSIFGDRRTVLSEAGLTQINTHVDPIDWHGMRSLVAPEEIVASLAGAVERRAFGKADRDEPIGLLTHHLVHDEAVWSFCEELLVYFTSRDICLLRGDELFRHTNRATVAL